MTIEIAKASRTGSAVSPDAEISTTLLKQHPGAALYIGQIAAHGVTYNPEMYQAAGMLRKRVYVDEKQFIDPTGRLHEGTEWDYNDGRSIHFGVAELTDGQQQSKVLFRGGARFIMKHSFSNRLPVESASPAAFARGPAPLMSVEMSRFIARHPDPKEQFKISMAIVRAGFAWVEQHLGANTTYAMVEPGFARMLRQIDMPFEQLGPFLRIPHYKNTRNAVIALQSREVLHATSPEKHFLGKEHMIGFFKDSHIHKGIGYFAKDCITPV
jgi:N-acyl-L-homoserine lactone synthetase